MPDKPLSRLWEIDRILRKLFPTKEWKEKQTLCTIRMVSGYELFKTRSHHNEEVWSDGYEISTKLFDGLCVTAEDLDSAIFLFVEAINEYLYKTNQQTINIYKS